MTPFIYSDQPVARRRAQLILAKHRKLDPNRQFSLHYANYKLLKWIFDTSSDFEERQQASAEMLIALSKMLYWEQHPDWDLEIAVRFKFSR